MPKKIYIAINLNPFNPSGSVNFNFKNNKVKARCKIYGKYTYIENDTAFDYYFDSKVKFYIKKICDSGKIKNVKIRDLNVDSANNVNPADHTDEFGILYDVDGNLCDNVPDANCDVVYKNIYNSIKNLIYTSDVSIDNDIGKLTVDLTNPEQNKITILDMRINFKYYCEPFNYGDVIETIVSIANLSFFDNFKLFK